MDEAASYIRYGTLSTSSLPPCWTPRSSGSRLNSFVCLARWLSLYLTIAPSLSLFWSVGRNLADHLTVDFEEKNVKTMGKNYNWKYHRRSLNKTLINQPLKELVEIVQPGNKLRFFFVWSTFSLVSSTVIIPENFRKGCSTLCFDFLCVYAPWTLCGCDGATRTIDTE